MRFHPFGAVAVLSLAVGAVTTPVVYAQAYMRWRPVDPKELAQKEPQVDKDAPAEALFWDVHIHDEFAGGYGAAVQEHYLRIKIFTEQGKAQQGQVEIPYGPKTNISDVDARTIRADGSILEMKGSDVFDKTIVKKGGRKVKAKTFALPGVEPGAIVEYHWRQVTSGQVSDYIELPLQREVPVQSLTYSIKALPPHYTVYTMSANAFHIELPVQQTREGFFTFTLKNVAAQKEEPQMPPENEVRAWMLVYYSERPNQKPEKFWKEVGRRVYGDTKADLMPDSAVRDAARAIVGDAATDDAKLERLYNYCREKIAPLDDDASVLTAEQRESAKKNRTPGETLARAQGTDRDIDTLFGALAAAAGFDVRAAVSVDRNRTFFDETFLNAYFLREFLIAVRAGTTWRFFQPSARYAPFGMLPWQVEGVKALVADPASPEFVMTPLSEPPLSVVKREGTFRLSEDGTLEGDVRVERTGHKGQEEKEALDDLSEEERLERVRDGVKERLGGVELQDVKVENATDPKAPIVLSYHVTVPGFAERTGKRLFLHPAYFQRGLEALFSSSERRYPVYFHYPWSEEDRVTITLPPGYGLDHPEAPRSFSGGAAADYRVKLSVQKEPYGLIYERKFWFGGAGTVLFDPPSYPTLKQFFEAIHQADDHMITLKSAVAP